MSTLDTLSTDPSVILDQERTDYEAQFRSLDPKTGLVTGDLAKGFFPRSHLPLEVLHQICALANTSSDGKMDLNEFSIASKMINFKVNYFDVPQRLPWSLLATLPQSRVPHPSHSIRSTIGFASTLTNSLPLVTTVTPVNGPPAEVTPVIEAPVDGPRAEVAPVNLYHVIKTSINMSPFSVAPVNGSPVGVAPVTTAPLNLYHDIETSFNMSPVNVEPVSVAPVNVAPINEAPLNMESVNVAPVYARPVKEEPATFAHEPVARFNVAPVNVAPVNVAPVNVGPINVAPFNVRPINVAPFNVGPVNVVPVNVVPVNVQPVNVEPVNVAPVNMTSAGMSVTKVTWVESCILDWAVPYLTKKKYMTMFNRVDCRKSGFLSRTQAWDVMAQTKLPQNTLRKIWALSDLDSDERMGFEEFVLAMHLCQQASLRIPPPVNLPANLIPPYFRTL